MKALLYGVFSATALLASLAHADEKEIKSLIEQRFPGIKVDNVLKTPFLGLYEVDSNGRIIYTDEQVSYVLQGSLIDAKTRTNLTQERMTKLSAIPFNTLPLDQAIKIVKGNGKRQLAIFEDPMCPFCKKLEADLSKVKDVTLYVFLYPIEQIHPGATEKSQKIWCAKDRAKAWQTAMLDGNFPEEKPKCDTPVEKLAKFGREHQITGTPTLVFANGTRVPGAIPVERIEKLLDESKPK
jgi:thiol:disulfide interchange protein DsbC